MTANFYWDEYNGAGETKTANISNLNFGSVDSPNLVPADYPIKASENSYGKYIKGAFSGSFTRVENFKLWKSAGNYVTGESCQFSGSVSYAQPAATDYGDPTVPTSEPGSPNVGISGDVDGHIDGPADDGNSKDTDYMRFQLLTTGSTPSGPVNQKTFTFQYDEQ
jgi:hypothetical protein